MDGDTENTHHLQNMREDKPKLLVKVLRFKVSRVVRNRFLCRNLNIYKSVTTQTEAPATTVSPTCSERAGGSPEESSPVTSVTLPLMYDVVWCSLHTLSLVLWCCCHSLRLLLTLLLSPVLCSSPTLQLTADSCLTLSCRGLSRHRRTAAWPGQQL